MILKCVIISNIAGIQEIKFAITDAKLYDPVVTLSAHDNGKLLQELKPGFKRTKSLNKHQSKVTIKTPNSYLYFRFFRRNFESIANLLCFNIISI